MSPDNQFRKQAVSNYPCRKTTCCGRLSKVHTPFIYIYNGNNDAMTQSNGDGGFLRVIIRVIFLFLPLTTRSANHPRHFSRTSHLPHSDFKFRIPGFGLPASSRQPVPSPTYRLSPCLVHGLFTSAVR